MFKEFVPYLLFLLVFIIIMTAIFLPLYRKAQKKMQSQAIIIKDLELSLQEARKLKNEKDKLIRVMIHDISNPLLVTMYHLEVIKRDALCGARGSDLIQKSCKNLKVINEILKHIREFECVMTGNRTHLNEEAYVAECLAEIETIFVDRFREKNVRLNILNELPKDTKIKFGKNQFIYNVASNLVSNALKFSRANSEVLIRAYENQSTQIVVEVVDNGVGMPKEILETLFDIEIAISRIGTAGERGCGFGMPIVKAYTTLFGGNIVAKSSQESEFSGTTISLFLQKNGDLLCST